MVWPVILRQFTSVYVSLREHATLNIEKLKAPEQFFWSSETRKASHTLSYINYDVQMH